jgi:O-methyltransferase domain/Dimerisation domain
MSSNNIESFTEATALLRLVFGLVPAQALYVAAELGIADDLAHGPLTAHDLARKTATHADALARLLRALIAFGVLRGEGEDRFALTSTGELLRTDVPGSLRATVRFLNGPWSWRAWEHLSYSVRTGQPAFDYAWGMSNFEYWARNPDVSEIHDDAMAGLTTLETARLLAAYDFWRFGTIVDVGGGNGSFLAALLRQHPQTKGILADLPHVVTQAAGILQQAGVVDRCQVVGGDFFEAAPFGGNLYILKRVIHDWDDERARTILRNCHRVMDAGTKLLIIDWVLPPQPTAEAVTGYIVDMTMLVVTPGGRERTQRDFQELLDSAGFKFTRVIRTGGLTDIVEAQRY